MSRGLGKLQRELLEMLRRHARGGAATAHEAACGLDTVQLTAHVYYGSLNWRWVDRAHLVAVRRALNSLHERELVVRLGTLGQGRVCRWHVGLWGMRRPAWRSSMGSCDP